MSCPHEFARALAPGGVCPLCLPADWRLGAYQTALADVELVDAVITDPPYGARTHKGHNSLGGRRRDGGTLRDLNYANWDREDIREFCEFWSPRCRGWIAAMSCSDLAPVWRQELDRVGRYAFHPVPCVIRGMTVRLSGDGPSSWAVYLNVARPRSKEFCGGWTRPGAYVTGSGERGRVGGKPLELMKQIVGDYSLEGELVVDPCGGHATTGVAALELGRRFLGAEVEPESWSSGATRLLEVA